MECAFDKVAIFLGCYLALAVNTNAARMSDHFAYHMLGLRILFWSLLSGKLRVGFSTNGPLGYVVRPLVGRDARRRIAESDVKIKLQSRVEIETNMCITLDLAHKRIQTFCHQVQTR